MTEPKPVYIADEYVRCPNCGMVIGYYVQEGNKTLLAINLVRAEVLHGRCGACNAEFHFVSSDKKLEDLVRRCKRPYNEVEA